jgi:hypothetical protein
MSQYILHEGIGLAMVAALRKFFGSHKFAQNFRWSSDPKKTLVEITEQWPQTVQVFPLIVVDTVYAGEADRYLSDIAHDVRVNNEFMGQHRGGADRFDCRITVNDYSKPTVDEITDILMFALKWEVDKDIWESTLFNVHFAEKVARMAGAGARPYTDNQLLYFLTISQQMKSYWFDEIVYDQRILSYLATTERESIFGSSTVTGQIQAG